MYTISTLYQIINFNVSTWYLKPLNIKWDPFFYFLFFYFTIFHFLAGQFENTTSQYICYCNKTKK